MKYLAILILFVWCSLLIFGCRAKSCPSYMDDKAGERNKRAHKWQAGSKGMFGKKSRIKKYDF